MYSNQFNWRTSKLNTLWSSGLSSDISISVLSVLHSQLRLMKYSSMETVLKSRFMSFVILGFLPVSRR